MKTLIPLLILFTAISTWAQSETREIGPPELKNSSDSICYFLGLNLGYSLNTAPFDVDPLLISRGLIQSQNGTAIHDQQTSQQILSGLQRAIAERESATAQAEGNANLEAGNKYLKENAQREGVITTPSGLQYEVIELGEGSTPSDTSTVSVHYEGSLIDGTIFDSSYERGEPLSIPINRVIAGWTEGVQLMPVGSTYKLFIPANLGYGARPAGQIPPHSTLIFKIKLLEIQ